MLTFFRIDSYNILNILKKIHSKIWRSHISWLKSRNQNWWWKIFEGLKVEEKFYGD